MNRESIIGKVLLKGKLVLRSPLLIGSGVERDGNDVDTQILRDKAGVPFIPGTSIAGVIRATLSNKVENAFFGGEVSLPGDGKKGTEVQSAVNIDDIFLHDAKVVLRDGVAIDNMRGVAVEERKYDYELVERGAEGDFCAEITLRGYHKELFGDYLPKVVHKLAEGVATGFRVGAMTAKGFGHVQVEELALDYYNFTKKDDALAWLAPDRGKASLHEENLKGKENAALTESNFVVDADFALKGSVIVKDTDVPPDKQRGDSPVHAVMKESLDDYLIPGPSVKGAMRHCAARILEQLGFSETRNFLNHLMGLDADALKEKKKLQKNNRRRKEEKESSWQSRFLVDEVYIPKQGVTPFAQTRNRIDRFTGGTIGGALFTTEGVWDKGDNSPIHIHFEIRDAEDHEIGLALLLLRELSVGRLPLGGEKSIGRGVLEGKHAVLRFQPKDRQSEVQNFTIESGKLTEGDKTALQNCVDALTRMAQSKNAEQKTEAAI